jgi:hypothetical protein
MLLRPSTAPTRRTRDCEPLGDLGRVTAQDLPYDRLNPRPVNEGRSVAWSTVASHVGEPHRTAGAAGLSVSQPELGITARLLEGDRPVHRKPPVRQVDQNGTSAWMKAGVRCGSKREYAMDQSGSRPGAGLGTYIPRLVDQRLSELFAQLPALLITGPRATGKTTTARRQHVTTVVRLDRPAEAAAFRADPDVALRAQPEPVLLDEWQAVPEVLGAVKWAVDDDPRPRRFLLTGSVRADLDQEMWPGTGRLVRLRMHGITPRELTEQPTGPLFLDRLATADIREFHVPPVVPDLRDYIDYALRSGFPEPLLRLSGAAHQAWLDGYLDQLLTRDAQDLLPIRDPARCRRSINSPRPRLKCSGNSPT